MDKSKARQKLSAMVMAIISGYICELKKSNISAFAFSNNVLYIYSQELTEEQYNLVDFISELITLHQDVQMFSRYDVMDRVRRIENNYSVMALNYYPLQCAIDSAVMILETEEYKCL